MIAFATQGIVPNLQEITLSVGIVLNLPSREISCSETEEYANLECSIIEVRIEDGIATVEEMAAQLDKLKIIGRGEIDLDTEQLDMTMRTKTREGFGVSIGGVVNSFLAIGGTLSEPALNVDPAGSVTTAGAAVATGGMSVLAKSLWDRLSAEVDICSEEATQ